MISAGLVVLAVVGFGLQPARAYEAPWCAVISKGTGSVYWDCQFARSKNADRMCWQAIVAGAIRTRTSSVRIGRQNIGITASVTLARSEVIG
jgi:hypothetical protein